MAEPDTKSVPPPSVPPAAKWIQKDSAAATEEKEWNKLDEAKQNNDLLMVKAYGLIVPVFAFVFSGIFLLSLIAWVAHYLMPACWAWLSPEQLSKIQSVLFSGGMGAVISSIVKRQLDRISEKKS